MVSTVMVGAFLLTTAVLFRPAEAQDDERNSGEVAVNAFPRWGASPAGAWTPYQVELANDGPADIEGDVVLLPNPPPPNDAPPLEFGAGPAVVVLNDRSPADEELTNSARPVAPRWPAHRMPVSLAGGGGRKVLTVMVVEAPFGYRAELRSPGGRALAVEPRSRTAAAIRSRWTVAVMSRTAAEQLFRSEPAVTSWHVSHIRSARDFPHELLLLSGLQVVVISDFDTASLSAEQIGALRAFVGLGGSLVLGGGAAGSRTLAPLPEELVPLRPLATATSDLGPLTGGSTEDGDLSSILTGDVRGRTTARAANGTPLIVESAYGAGHVVQLAYDPFDELFISRHSGPLHGLEAGLEPAFEPLTFDQTSRSAPMESLWRMLLTKPPPLPPPSWPPWGIGVLVLYVVSMGPLSYAVLRLPGRRKASATLLFVAMTFVVLSGVAGAARTGPPAPAVDNVVRVETVGPDGSALVNTFHGLHELDEPPVDRLPLGVAASTVIAHPGRPPVSNLTVPSAFGGALAQPYFGGGRVASPMSPDADGVDGAGIVIADRKGQNEVAIERVDKGEVATYQTLSALTDRGGLDADLRVTRSSSSGEQRVTGSVTNRTGRRLRSLRIQHSQGRQAELAPTVAPGMTVIVDAALISGQPSSDQAQLAEQFVASASAAQPGRTALVALMEPVRPAVDTRSTRLEILVQAAPQVRD